MTFRHIGVPIKLIKGDSPWASITPRAPPTFQVLLYILLRKKHANIENFGTNLPFEANIYILSQLFEDF